jgi:hypothetical protein
MVEETTVTDSIGTGTDVTTAAVTGRGRSGGVGV